VAAPDADSFRSELSYIGLQIYRGSACRFESETLAMTLSSLFAFWPFYRQIRLAGGVVGPLVI
jgi:hypothetical protein